MSGDSGDARFLFPDRSQLSWDLVDLDGWLPADHRARVVWAFVESLDLSALYAKIKARGERAGRPAADPRVLLALWLYAIIEGIGSAREVDRLARKDLAYRWLAGGVPVNYHGLAEFRVLHTEVLDDLMTRSLTALMVEGLVTLDEVVADGTKVKAHSGRNSYKTAEQLKALEADVRARIKALKSGLDDDPGAGTKRRQAARKRAARERGERLAKARQTLEKMAEERKQRGKKSPREVKNRKAPRASLTDPEARTMRFADGAAGPGYNIQIANPAGSGLILSVQVTDQPVDNGMACVVVDNIERRFGKLPGHLICDTTYAGRDNVNALAARSVTVWTPPTPDKPTAKPASLQKRAKRRARESDAIKQWRIRMETDKGAQQMRKRKRIELTNAHLKNRGFARPLVRGLAKLQSWALLHALAHNVMAAHALRTRTA